MKFITLILFAGWMLFCNSQKISAWDSTAAKYMPLQEGNVWVYYSEARSYPYLPGKSFIKYRVSGIVDTLNVKFYRIEKSEYIINGNGGCVLMNYLLRIDSVTMNLMYAGNGCTGYENILDSLLSKRGDTVRTCNYTYRVCIDTTVFSYFSNTYSSKEYTNERGNFRSVYLKGIGRIRNGWAELMNYCFDTLKGCLINGVLHGDTSTIVGINQLSTELPERFELSQNYPNPFNPVTKIKFSIPHLEVAHMRPVQLKVYDAVGKEVAILVNQQLEPGTYEADWDASSYPSGVYYYKLKVETSQRDVFTETKKMVLIK